MTEIFRVFGDVVSEWMEIPRVCTRGVWCVGCMGGARVYNVPEFLRGAGITQVQQGENRIKMSQTW